MGRLDDLQRACVGEFCLAPGQLGQNASGAEPGRVVGMADQHRGFRGRAEDTRLRDLLAQERVDERRFPGTRRAADDSQQRRIECQRSGQEVVTDLSADAHRLLAEFGRSGKFEGEFHSLECFEQILE